MAVDVRLLSIGFLVILIIAEFLSYVKAVLAITGPRLLSTGLLIIMVAGFLAADVISTGLGVRFSVVLIALSSAMFLLLVEVAFAGGEATACAEPLILLCLNATVFLNLD
jgi:hypothetical protein